MASRFIAIHQPCPGCGSSDAYAVNSDGSGKCYSCGQFFKKGKGEVNSRRVTGRMELAKPKNLQALGIASRLITPEVMAEYKAGFDEEGNLACPLIENGMTLGYKLKTRQKRCWFELGNNTTDMVGLWGKWVCKSHGKLLIITEGLEDCMAVRSITGYSVVSIPSGVVDAVKYVLKDLEWVESFEKVIILFDNDEPGQRAAREVISVLDEEKAALGTLPPQYKDPSQLGQLGLTKERALAVLRHTISTAQQFRDESFISGESLLDKTVDLLISPEKRKGEPTGWQGLDALIGGLRPGEIIPVIADTGCGKSTMTRAIAYNQAAQNHNVCLVSVEDTPELGATHFLSMLLEQQAANREWTKEEAEKEILDNEKVVEFFNHLSVLDKFDWESVEGFLKTVKTGLRKNRPRVLILDHITAVAERFGNETQSIGKILSELQAYALSFGTTIFVVTHTSGGAVKARKKSQICPGLYDVKWASSIVQVGAPILSLGRAHGLVCLQVAKPARLWRRTGEIWLQYDEASGNLFETAPPDTQETAHYTEEQMTNEEQF